MAKGHKKSKSWACSKFSAAGPSKSTPKEPAAAAPAATAAGPLTSTPKEPAAAAPATAAAGPLTSTPKEPAAAAPAATAAGPSTSTPKEPAAAAPATTAAPAQPCTPRRRLPVANSPSPHSSGGILCSNDGNGKAKPFVHNIRGKVRQAVLDQIQALDKDFCLAERNISSLSNIRISSSSKQQSEEAERDAEDQVSSFFKAALDIKKKQLATVEACIDLLNKEGKEGFFDDNQTFKSTMDLLEQRQNLLRGDVIVLHTSCREICGRILDDSVWLQRQNNDDWAYIDMLISRYKTPQGAKLSLFAPRDAKAQERFRKSVFKSYDASNPTNPHFAWCPISATWHLHKDMRAAHIVRYNVGELAAVHLLGPAKDKDGHLMGAKNGIPIQASIR